MARSVLDIILSLKGDKARGELKKVDKSLDMIEKSAKKATSTFENTFQGIKANYLNLKTAVTDVVQGVRQAWDFAKHGAEVRQTGESWDFLLDKLKVSPDILDRMREEARGTVDDMTIMSSTMTLLAGTSDELGKKLLEQSPQLLKIAKAANKLNPSLGDTAFLYESISKGIKRASPLILDNLGLNIKMEEAFRAQAKALGKSVDALNSDERAMAILNDTMRAGDLLIDQVGGTVDAAGDSYARMEVAVTSLKDELAALASEGLEPAVTLAAEAVKTSRKNVGTWGRINQAVGDGIITQQEYNEWIVDYLFHGGKQSDLLATIESRMGLVDDAVIELTGHERAYTEQIIELTGHERAYIGVLEDVTEGTGIAEEATRNLKQEMSDLSLFIQGPLGKEYEKFTETQSELTEEIEETQKQIDELEKKDYLTKEQKKELEEAKKKVGELSAKFSDNADAHDEASKRIMFNLLTQRAAMDGFTDEETTALLDIAEHWGIVDTATREYVEKADEYMAAINSSTDENMGAVIGNLEKYLGIAETTQSSLFELKNRIDDIEGVHDVVIRVKVTGDPIPRNLPGQRNPRQHGGPVFPFESYLVGEAGPELFIPGTSGQIIPSYKSQRILSGTASADSVSRVFLNQRGGDNNYIFVQNSAAWAVWVEQQQQVEFDEIDQAL
jgi:predicted  nucleic acid-binding Zn-ribbon protein